jgi:hypothetical protein
MHGGPRAGTFLTGPLYSRVLRKIESARQTGSTTKITLLQQPVCVARVCPPMVYHVGLIGITGDDRRIFEHGPIKYDQTRPMCDRTLLIPLPSVRNTLDDISAFEAMLSPQYIVGIRDCRHHVLDLLDYLYGELYD